MTVTRTVKRLLANRFVQFVHAAILLGAISAIIIGHFHPGVTKWYSDYRVFEALVLFFLLEIFLLLLSPQVSEPGLNLCGDMTREVEAVMCTGVARYFDILSADLGRTRSLVVELLHRRAEVRLLVNCSGNGGCPDPEIDANLKFIKSQTTRDEHAKLTCAFYDKPPSIRMIIAYRDKDRVDFHHGWVGWYAYRYTRKDERRVLRLRGPSIDSIELSGAKYDHLALLRVFGKEYKRYWSERTDRDGVPARRESCAAYGDSGVSESDTRGASVGGETGPKGEVKHVPRGASSKPG